MAQIEIRAEINEEAEAFWDHKGLYLDDFDPVLFNKEFPEETKFLVNSHCYLRSTQDPSLMAVYFKVVDNFIIVTKRVQLLLTRTQASHSLSIASMPKCSYPTKTKKIH